MNKIATLNLSLILVLLTPNLGSAQQLLGSAPSFIISASNQGLEKTKNSSGTYKSYPFRFSQASLSFRYPVLFRVEPGKFRYIALQAGVGLAKAEFNKELLNRYFVNLKAGGLGFFSLGSKNNLLLAVNGLANEDKNTLSSPNFRLTSMALWLHPFSEKFAIHTGLSYSYVFGNGFLLPILGFKTRLNANTQLLVTLPFQIRTVSKQKDSPNRYGFFLKAQGGFNRYQSNLFIDSTSNTYFLRNRLLVLGGQYLLNRPGQQFQFTMGIGFRQRIQLTNESNAVVNDFSFTTRPIGVIGVRWTIPVKQVEQPENETILTDDWLFE